MFTFTFLVTHTSPGCQDPNFLFTAAERDLYTFVKRGWSCSRGRINPKQNGVRSSHRLMKFPFKSKLHGLNYLFSHSPHCDLYQLTIQNRVNQSFCWIPEQSPFPHSVRGSTSRWFKWQGQRFRYHHATHWKPLLVFQTALLTGLMSPGGLYWNVDFDNIFNR